MTERHEAGEDGARAEVILERRAERVVVAPSFARRDDDDRSAGVDDRRQPRGNGGGVTEATDHDEESRARSSAAIVDPFGEGRTRRGTGVHARRLAGESDGAGMACGRVASARPTASSASWWAANSAACPPFQGNGKTLIPRSTAMVTDVEKLNRSTITETSARATLAPVSPQSKRTSASPCPKRSAGLPLPRRGDESGLMSRPTSTMPPRPAPDVSDSPAPGGLVMVV